jgi:selenide,water dikinase
LEGLPAFPDPRLRVGFDTAEDASVFELQPGLLLVQTVDFFTPVVDDPYLFGSIAAANALSDVYAMGATPVTALNVVTYPRALGLESLRQILRGGLDKAAEAGIAVAGGHTVDDLEPKYGLVVTGTVSEEHLALNRHARPGEAILLTKPLGSGALTSALKRGEKTEADIAACIAVMEQLNAAAVPVMHRHGIRAATDVTGFGCLGHLWEMCVASGVGADLHAGALPVMPDALPLLRADKMPGGSLANREYLRPHVETAAGLDPGIVNALYDAQTSGGLLLAVPEAAVAQVLGELQQAFPWTRRIGAFRTEPGISIHS